MKKLATTIGLFTLMLIVTSFTTPNEVGGERSRPVLEVGGERSKPVLEVGGERSKPVLEVGGERSKPVLF